MKTKTTKKEIELEKIPQKKIISYKALDKDLKCCGEQFEVGKPKIYEGQIKICNSGYHSCLYGLDVLTYYNIIESRFAECEISGKIQTHSGDTKQCSKNINLIKEIGITELVNASVNYILSNIQDTKKESNTGDKSAATNTGAQSAATNTGYKSAATNTGDYSAATNTGAQSAATNTGDYSAATVEGKESIACGLGIENKAKGKKGCWLVLTEWEQYKESNWHIKSVKSVIVDGKKIKENVFYQLKNGKFVEVE